MDKYNSIPPQASWAFLGMIELNNSKGLKNLDESGLEGNNKILCSIRLNLARKNSQSENLEDTLRRKVN